MQILWFSRHPMTNAQRADLTRIYGEHSIVQVNGTMEHINKPFVGEVNGIEQPVTMSEFLAHCQVWAIVAPIGIQQQFLQAAEGEIPVIMCKNERIFTGGEKVVFKFVHWFQLKKIEIITEVL